MGQLSVLGSIFYYIISFGVPSLICSKNIRNKVQKFALMSVLPLILATIRYNVGYDYGSYMEGYHNSFFITYKSIFLNYKLGDPIGFDLVTKFATIFNSERIYLLILAALCLIPATIYIINQWDDTSIQPLILFCYYFTSYIFSFSAIKQGIAISFLMCSTTYIIKRKPIPFIILIGIACLFHSSAVVFIFTYFLWSKEKMVSTWKKWGVVVGCFVIMVNLQSVLSNFWGGRYEAYAVDIVEGANKSFFLYMLWALIFLVFRKMLVSFDERNELFIMMMLIGALFQILGFYNAFTKRIGEYFVMAQIFLIPQMPYVVVENQRKLVKVLIYIYIVFIFVVSTPMAESGMGFIPFSYKLY